VLLLKRYAGGDATLAAARVHISCEEGVGWSGKIGNETHIVCIIFPY